MEFESLPSVQSESLRVDPESGEKLLSGYRSAKCTISVCRSSHFNGTLHVSR